VNTRYETEHDLRDLNDSEPDREISLGATTILGIFFALALLCAVFFGFGYSQGRHSLPSVAAAPDSTPTSEANTTKPSPGSIAAPPPAQDKQSADTAIVPLTQPAKPSQDEQQMSAPDSIKADATEPPPAPVKSAQTTVTRQPAPIPAAAAVASSPGTSVVQVAAMSHQEDADVVAADLKRRGYPVAVRRVPQDKLFHVQIGPFATKKESDVMRQRLQTDGYNNAIVK
jgi:DedD protein